MEMVMAVTVTSITGLAVATVSYSLSKANENSQEFYESIQTGRTVVSRVQTMLRKGRLVTCTTQDSAMIWAEDSDENEIINLTELRIVKYDSNTQIIKEYRVVLPNNSGIRANNIELPLSVASQSYCIEKLIVYPYVTSSVIAENVREFSIDTDVPAPLARLLTIKMVVGEDDQDITLRSAVAMRDDMTDQIGLADGEYVLAESGESDDDDRGSVSSAAIVPLFGR